MNVFKNLFGLDPGDMQENCILLPCVNKDLLAAFGVLEFTGGKLYGCAQGDGFTLIHARIGACFVGDLVLYLKQTPCRQVFLFGSCGSAGFLDVGRLVLPVRCFARESFSALLRGEDKPWPVFYPDNLLCESFQKRLNDCRVDEVTCMTLSSLKLEEGLVEEFKDNKIDVLEMECSAFFAAASKIRLPAMGLFYVSDVVGKKPFHEDLSASDKQAVKAGMKNGIKALCGFMRKKQNG